MTTANLTQLPHDQTRTELATDAVASVAELVTHAINQLPVDSRYRFHELFAQGATIKVELALQNGAATISATLEGTPFFTVHLGSAERTETRH